MLDNKPLDSKYLEQSDLLDDLYEFHADWFSILSDHEMVLLDNYYGIVSTPSNLQAWRNEHCSRQAELAEAAQQVLRRLLVANGAEAVLS